MPFALSSFCRAALAGMDFAAAVPVWLRVAALGAFPRFPVFGVVVNGRSFLVGFILRGVNAACRNGFR